MPAAVLLDMDGTLVDSEPVHFRAHERFLASQGIQVTQADLVGNIGKGDLQFFEDLARRAGVACDPQAWVRAKTEILHELFRRDGVPLRPGVESLLHEAFVRGLPCVVVTNSERASARLALEGAGLGQRLPMRICHEDTILHKPDPAPYRLAAQRLGVSPVSCLAIEDSPSGVRSAMGAGCFTIAVAGLIPAASLRAAGAHRVLVSLQDFAGFDA